MHAYSSLTSASFLARGGLFVLPRAANVCFEGLSSVLSGPVRGFPPLVKVHVRPPELRGDGEEEEVQPTGGR